MNLWIIIFTPHLCPLCSDTHQKNSYNFGNSCRCWPWFQLSVGLNLHLHVHAHWGTICSFYASICNVLLAKVNRHEEPFYSLRDSAPSQLTHAYKQNIIYMCVVSSRVTTDWVSITFVLLTGSAMVTIVKYIQLLTCKVQYNLGRQVLATVAWLTRK